MSCFRALAVIASLLALGACSNPTRTPAKTASLDVAQPTTTLTDADKAAAEKAAADKKAAAEARAIQIAAGMKIFNAALTDKRWADAKAAADALPEPARIDSLVRLTDAANQSLATVMATARDLTKAGEFDTAAITLATEKNAVPYADAKISEGYINLFKIVRAAAKETQP